MNALVIKVEDSRLPLMSLVEATVKLYDSSAQVLWVPKITVKNGDEKTLLKIVAQNVQYPKEIRKPGL